MQNASADQAHPRGGTVGLLKAIETMPGCEKRKIGNNPLRAGFQIGVGFTMMDERLIELEIKAGQTEILLEELNRTLFRQQREIDRLKEQLRFLYREMKADAEAGEGRSPTDDRPPHY
jgi:SlyX protein